jgi:hypothetical protein
MPDKATFMQEMRDHLSGATENTNSDNQLDSSLANDSIPPAKSATGTNKCGKRHKGGPQRRAPVRSFH